MKSFHRLFLLIFLFLIFLTNSAGAEEVILSFSSYATVKVDASLEVREDITVWAEGKQIQRGIYRDFPTIYRDTSGKIVRVGFLLKELCLTARKFHTEQNPALTAFVFILAIPIEEFPLENKLTLLSM